MSENRLACWNVQESDYPADAPLEQRLAFLIRYAILAPSSHNSEPWQFRVRHDSIEVLLDYSRWLRVADDDQRELHISVGCAVENLLIAAEHFDLAHELELLPRPEDPRLAARITFDDQREPAAWRPDILFAMLPIRHTNHGRYEPRPIPDTLLEQCQALAQEPGIALHTTDQPQLKRQIDDLVIRGDAIEFADPAFRDELAYWIGQGVFGTGWLIAKLGQLAIRHIDMGTSQGRKDSDVLLSSPVVGLISSEHDDRHSQIRTGQVFQRVALLGAALGVWNQPMSQIVQVPQLKTELATLLAPAGWTPQHPFRMGFAAAERHHTPRRPVADVLV